MKRPALDYFGGKWKHAARIIETFPEHKTFVDVFCGAASITLRKPRSKNEIINDVNDELVNFFSILRDRNLELRLALEKLAEVQSKVGMCIYGSSDTSHDPEVAYRQGSYQAWCDTGSIANEALIAITELIAKRGKA